MQPPLLLSKRFAPLFWCQFFAAFNDNFLKTSLVFLILFGTDLTASEAAALITLASAIFIAPYFILSGLGGELADRYDKARVAQWLKFAEILIALIAVAGYTRQSIPLLFVALLGFGLIAALFGPLKYGILPDHLERERLPAANALIEGATFIAILTGTIVGGIAAQGGGARLFGLLVMGRRLLAVGLAHPAERRRRAASQDHQEHRPLDRRHAPPSARRHAIMVGRAGDELVLAHRHCRAVVAAAADQVTARRQ